MLVRLTSPVASIANYSVRIRNHWATNIYTFNFYDIEKEKGSKVWIKTYDLGKLTPIFYEIEKEILEQKWTNQVGRK